MILEIFGWVLIGDWTEIWMRMGDIGKNTALEDPYLEWLGGVGYGKEFPLVSSTYNIYIYITTPSII